MTPEQLPEPENRRHFKEWYRRYLPHFDHPGALQSITFRLADSLPHEYLERLNNELESVAPEKLAILRRKRIEQSLDAGMGCCALKHPAVAAVVQESILKFDGERYQVVVWCIMPNHVHVLIKAQAELGKIVQSWKSFSGRWAMMRNAELGLGVPGKAFWMREYWDRYIRDAEHLANVVRYV
jgi:type I restriction enzyme R subunit/putative DNA methylase